MADVERPPFPGEWRHAELGNTGAWSVGHVWLNDTEGGYCLRVETQHCNALGVMHGGAMATLVDAQMLAAPGHVYDPQRHTPTITLSVDYLAPAPLGGWLMITARVLRTTKTMIFTDALVTVDGTPVARSNAIYRNHPNAGAPK